MPSALSEALGQQLGQVTAMAHRQEPGASRRRWKSARATASASWSRRTRRFQAYRSFDYWGERHHEAEIFSQAKVFVCVAAAGTVTGRLRRLASRHRQHKPGAEHRADRRGSVAQTLKQIDNQNPAAAVSEPAPEHDGPAAYTWDQAQATINGLMNATNTLNYYRNQLGSLDSYLGKFQDVNYYRSSPLLRRRRAARMPSAPG